MSGTDNIEIPDRLLQRLSANDAGFLQRVYSDGLDKYKKHLARIGFIGVESILDAGCGFGQWTFAIAQTSKRAIGVDVDSERLSVSIQLASINDVKNVEFHRASLEDMPNFEETFDAVFCYSVVYLTDYHKVFRNFFRSLKKGGTLYICTNGPGWYLYNIIEGPNPSMDFRPRWYGIQTFWNTLIRKRSGFSRSTGARIMTPSGTKRALNKSGFEVVALGAEGTLAIGDGQISQPASNYNATYMGLVNVFEVIARKP
ncbi:class I SAM-dependent methyltransferase [Candidatus Poribacteria bacterium]|nr:class I SAM-dependent methyltransferase [Candidatus Poribacteria bacterium]